MKLIYADRDKQSAKFIDVKMAIETTNSISFRCPPQSAPLFIATPNSLLDNAKRWEVEWSELHDEIIGANITVHTATFENVCLPITNLENRHAIEMQLSDLYAAVSMDKEVRDASIEAQKTIQKICSARFMRHDIFLLVDAV